MSTGVKIFFGSIAVLVLLAIIYATSYIGAHNSANQQEQSIDAAVSASQTSLNTMTQTVMETARVPPMARDDLALVVRESLEGRYGEGGSDAMFQAITENYPGQLDMALYTRIQDAIESGRRNFAASQNDVIDKVRGYKTDLGSFWTGKFMGWAGYPRIDLTQAKYNPIVSTQTRVSFDTGVDTGIQF